MDVKFFVCKHCKKIITMIKETAVPTICCGEAMSELLPNVEGASEKHTPVIKVEGNLVTVSVGEVTHPMEESHFIEWIILVTDKGIQKKNLIPGDAPVAQFALLDGEKVETAYEHCNLHGLWKK